MKTTELHVPGFQHLGWLLPQHVDLVPELYFLFIALMMGQPIKLLPADSKVTMRNHKFIVHNIVEAFRSINTFNFSGTYIFLLPKFFRTSHSYLHTYL